VGWKAQFSLASPLARPRGEGCKLADNVRELADLGLSNVGLVRLGLLVRTLLGLLLVEEFLEA